MKNDISGFPEFLPNEQIVFNRVMDSIKAHFESYGFVPMDTPAVERIETLLAKGNDSEIYGIYRLADESSKKSLGLRFDLTVPFARYIAAYHGEMVFPHKRYQIAPVWRGERPQSGRYRQFYQCDIDVIGENALSIEHDAEVLKLITEILLDLNLPKFTTQINNRKVLTGFLWHIMDGNSNEDKDKLGQRITECVRLIDKMKKISAEEFWEQLKEFDICDEGIEKLRLFLDLERNACSNAEVLNYLKQQEFGLEFSAGVNELETVVNLLTTFGIDDKCVRISTSLARGLSYYTGTVLETTFDEMADIGSICGGGRYDNLTATISKSNINFVGVGASVGISRIVPKLVEKGWLRCDKLTPAELLVTVQDRKFLGDYMRISGKFRELGIKTETYLENKPLAAQMSYANRKKIRYALIANEEELIQKRAILRNLETKEQKVVDLENIEEEIFAKIRCTEAD